MFRLSSIGANYFAFNSMGTGGNDNSERLGVMTLSVTRTCVWKSNAALRDGCLPKNLEGQGMRLKTKTTAALLKDSRRCYVGLMGSLKETSTFFDFRIPNTTLALA